MKTKIQVSTGGWYCLSKCNMAGLSVEGFSTTFTFSIKDGKIIIVKTSHIARDQPKLGMVSASWLVTLIRFLLMWLLSFCHEIKLLNIQLTSTNWRSICLFMITTWYGNAFRIASPWWEESTSHRWISLKGTEMRNFFIFDLVTSNLC